MNARDERRMVNGRDGSSDENWEGAVKGEVRTELAPTATNSTPSSRSLTSPRPSLKYSSSPQNSFPGSSIRTVSIPLKGASTGEARRQWIACACKVD
mgnify:CR=1 FL=1